MSDTNRLSDQHGSGCTAPGLSEWFRIDQSALLALGNEAVVAYFSAIGRYYEYLSVVAKSRDGVGDTGVVPVPAASDLGSVSPGSSVSNVSREQRRHDWYQSRKARFEPVKQMDVVRGKLSGYSDVSGYSDFDGFGYCYQSLFREGMVPNLGAFPRVSSLLEAPSECFQSDEQLMTMFVSRVGDGRYHLGSSGVPALQALAAVSFETGLGALRFARVKVPTVLIGKLKSTDTLGGKQTQDLPADVPVSSRLECGIGVGSELRGAAASDSVFPSFYPWNTCKVSNKNFTIRRKTGFVDYVFVDSGEVEYVDGVDLWSTSNAQVKLLCLDWSYYPDVQSVKVTTSEITRCAHVLTVMKDFDSPLTPLLHVGIYHVAAVLADALEFDLNYSYARVNCRKVLKLSDLSDLESVLREKALELSLASLVEEDYDCPEGQSWDLAKVI